MRSLFRLLALALFLPLAGCEKRADPLTSAKTFFGQISTGHAEDAYRGASFAFQAQRSSTTFSASVKDMGLLDFTGADWGKPERNGHTVTIPVKIKTHGGTEIPLIVTLIDQTGAWRVFSLKSPPSQDTGQTENRFSLVGQVPSFSDAVQKPMPPENEIRQLVRENLLRFNEAITSQSFDAFYESVATHWQDQLTKGQLQRAFQPFIDQKINLGGIADAPPIFDEAPAINSEGLLIANGHYETKPYRVQFAMRFYYELPTWKLFGLDVNILK
ncbi:hypothetical protein CfE428DRAFT_2100 [Chthoniobacter flavus Ellin428]|uniref:DUF4878 domain-containing protein n=1 Tax=Chthoniobacter flavus Ellin428 TaxID=497964 RepID=B4CZL2_9BACT|nr:hypothetical protein [Chthoniobacter flavus]EDY20176.1 hypothetical protein CfE428DRAFT_2100 [Chthoniobacter flavus Ellin428]TCO94074.1 hypothetical protein EV701_103161 [Chthoniobacter flavus]